MNMKLILDETTSYPDATTWYVVQNRIRNKCDRQSHLAYIRFLSKKNRKRH